MEPWHDFLVASAGAAAVLAGLIFVGISINLEKILAFKSLPDRALESLIILTNVLVLSLLLLVPDQSPEAVGIELGVAGLTVWLLVLRFDVRTSREIQEGNESKFALMVVLGQISTLPFVVAGSGVLAHVPGLLIMMVVGIVASVIRALLDAWVLLVEVNR